MFHKCEQALNIVFFWHSSRLYLSCFTNERYGFLVIVNRKLVCCARNRVGCVELFMFIYIITKIGASDKSTLTRIVYATYIKNLYQHLKLREFQI